MSKKVLLTGVSSFTGCHIARALVDAGFEVVATLTRERNAYESKLITQRLEWSKVNVFFPAVAFGSDAFLQNIKDLKPEVFINHGASIEGYRRPDFDYLASLKGNLFNAREVIGVLKQNHCRVFIQSGSFFEPDEGFGPNSKDYSTPALSIYGVSKQMAWQALRYFCFDAHLPIAKVVIPNPIGAFENPDRLSPLCASLWSRGESPKLFTPNLKRDHLPAEWLARVYVKAANNAETHIYRPSGFVMTNKEFVARLAKAIVDNSEFKNTPIKVESKETHEAPLRENLEAVAELNNPAQVKSFWDGYAKSLIAAL